VLADPASQAARVNAFLGGRLDAAAMAAVADRALYRNRRDDVPAASRSPGR
jgi:hypothetical protein